MGFDPTKIGSDERAKRVFGEKEVFRIDELLNKPRLTIKKGDYSAKGEIVGRAWVFEVKAKVPTGRGNEVRDERVGHGSIMLQPSSTEPGKWVPEHGSTLDFTLDNRVVVGGRQWRLKFEGAEQLTDYVLKESITQFTKQTGAAPELGGSLAWDNKLQFQHAYAEVARTHKSMSPQQIADLAIMQTPFGQARGRAGYRVTATPSATMTQILTGTPPRLADVPESVTAHAVPEHR